MWQKESKLVLQCNMFGEVLANHMHASTHPWKMSMQQLVVFHCDSKNNTVQITYCPLSTSPHSPNHTAAATAA